MRRIPFLIPYSHDHQHALAQSLRLRRAARAADRDPGTLARRIDEALAFASGPLADHMRREERLLFPRMQELGCLLDGERERSAREHELLERLATSLARRRNARSALAFAEALHDHVRWEERQLFEAWQARLAALTTVW